MNSLDRKFKELVQDEINGLYLDAQKSLNLPVTPEMASDIHEIGSLRGYMKAALEIYDICDEIMKKLTDPEKKA